MKNVKYSFGDFTDKSFIDEPVSDFNNTTIKGSCFYQQYFVDSEIFPAGMTGVTFENCNLDNIFIPDGNVIVGGCNRKVCVQNDGQDWVLDDSHKPLEPVSKKRCIQEGRSIDPAEIPAKYELELEVDSEDYNNNYESVLPENSYFKAPPQIISTRDVAQVALVSQDDYDSMIQGYNLGKFRPTPKKITLATNPPPAGKILIVGEVTMHTVRGEAYKFKDKDGGMH